MPPLVVYLAQQLDDVPAAARLNVQSPNAAARYHRWLRFRCPRSEPSAAIAGCTGIVRRVSAVRATE